MKLLRTLAVGYIHYPHVWILKLIGPRMAVVLARLTAWCHWLLTFAGAERRTRTAMASVQCQWESQQSLNTVLRRHLQVKHQNFTEWYLYSTARGRRYVKQSYPTIEGHGHLDSALTAGCGAIVLVSHFGLAKMAIPALMAHGYDGYLHVFRGATYAGSVYEGMARAAMRRLAETEANSGVKFIYHRPLTAFVTMIRVLRRGGIIAINADGMRGDDFVEVPFLSGTIQLPAGPAQLSAQSGAPIIPGFVLPNGLFGHRLALHSPLVAQGTSREEVAATVREYASLIERYVRRYPWAWWTWRRLQIERTSDGTIRFSIQVLATTDSVYRPVSMAQSDERDPSPSVAEKLVERLKM